MKTPSHRLNYLALIVTWAIVFGLSIAVLRNAAGQFEGILAEAIPLQILILALMLLITSRKVGEQGIAVGRSLTALLFFVIMYLAWKTPLSFLFVYSIIWMTVLPYFFSTRVSFALLFIVLLSWYIVMKVSWEDVDAVVDVLLLGTFHFFGLISSMATKSADAANEKAQRLNRELIATQSLLTSVSKQNERTRIARNLHDLLGHHLTALTINLQVAGRLVDGEAKEKVDQCHSLSKLLLSDVRDAVSTMRSESIVDVNETLTLIAENVPNLTVNLDIDPNLSIDDVNAAEALLRCVQESITNTLRHSGANESWVKVWEEDDQLQIHIRDDGRADEKFVTGNGLRGMRERVERLNGRFSINAADGMQISIQIPAAL